jgi:hypothetical protein
LKEDTPQLGDLIRLDTLKKVDADMPQAILSPKVGGLDDLAGKLEDNRDVTVGEMTQVFGDLAKGVGGIKKVDYFGDELSWEEFDSICGGRHEENTKMCAKILNEPLEEDDAGGYDCQLTYLPRRVAKKLAEVSTEFLGLESLGVLSMNLLKQLAGEVIDLMSLPGPVLDREKARFLAENWEGLSVVGEINLEVMEELIKIIRLSLGTDKIDLDAAKILAKHRGSLELNNLRAVTLKVAAELGKHFGALHLGLYEIDREEASLIAGNRGDLILPNLKDLDKDSARALAKHRSGELRLGMDELEVEVAEELVKYPGKLALENLSYSIPDEVAMVLAIHNNIFAGNGNEKVNGFRKKKV